MDQADRLRAMASVNLGASHTRIVSITSGKGGVGKTNISLNVAISLARKGLKVLLVDGDFGLANANILLGCQPEKSIEDILFKNAEFKDVIISTRFGIDLLPGSSGVRKMLELDAFTQRALTDKLAEIMESYHYVIFDTAPGIASHVLTLNSAAHEVVVVTHPEPMALTDAYALIKVLEKERKIKKFRLLINRSRDLRDGLESFRRITDVSQQFLNCSVDYLGNIPEDIHVLQSVRKQVPVSLEYPQAPFTQAIQRICDKILHFSDKAPVKEHFKQNMATSILGVNL